MTSAQDKTSSATQKKTREKAAKKITPDYLRNAGLYYLGKFASSTEQFRTVMGRKITKSCAYHTNQDVNACILLLDNLINDFQRSGLLNDELYAAGIVNSMRQNGKSASSIRQKLLKKGINKDLTNSKIIEFNQKSENTDEETEFNAALIFARKRKLGPFNVRNMSEKKQLATFARAGFSYQIAKKIISDS